MKKLRLSFLIMLVLTLALTAFVSCGKTADENGACNHKLLGDQIEEVTEEAIIARFCCKNCGALFLKEVDPDGDDDKDGLKNSVEITLNTSPFLADTDGDGLDDKEEVGEYNTNPLLADSDDDGLNDYEEINNYSTKPNVADTDGDGVLDGKEVLLGFNPLFVDSNFTVNYTPDVKDDSSVQPSISASLTAEQINSLKVERSDVISKNSVGYLGDAYDFSVDEDTLDYSTPVSLTVGFKFDQSSVDANAQPTIYAIEKNAFGINHMTPVATTVSNGQATALVDKFTTYVLADRTILEKDLVWIDVYDIDKNYDKLEIVFVIDDSGSMTSNDYYNKRLDVAKDLIDKLPTDTKIGIVAFGDKSYDFNKFTGSTLITDKAVAKSYLTTSYFRSDGNSTHMYDAINRALPLFESTDDNTMRMMVVLTDGEAHDTNLHNSIISTTNSYGVNLYTIGLGSSTSYFNNYLKPLASGTDGEFYLAADASNLAEAFEAIGEKLSLTVDSDVDGLSDYYEENTVIFSGIDYSLDKTNPDTDGDGLLDGEEIVTTIIYSADGKQMSVTGVVKSNPSMKDSDGDGVNDAADKYPMDASR